jgi:hypothetical protein
MRHRLIVCLGFTSLALFGILGSVAGSENAAAETQEPDVLETGFRLHGSHGYSISVSAYSVRTDGRGTIEFFVHGRGASVSYRAPAIVTDDILQADLPGIAKVELVRRRSGRQRKVRPKCLRTTLTYEPATYEGTIRFEGEQGYTYANADHVAFLPFWLVFATHGVCSSGYGEATGTGVPGARLRGVSFAHGRRLFFQVNKNGRHSPVFFTASLRERRNGVLIDREVNGKSGSAAFRFAPSLGTATLSPPDPFSGSASATRTPNSVLPSWTGGLSLDFPGRRNVPIAGPDVHVSLVHAHFTRSSDSSVVISG